MIGFFFFNMILLYILMVIFLLTTGPFLRRLILLIICFSLLFILNSFSNWLNFILCLIYLGGIIIIFVYISSILPNKKNLIIIFSWFPFTILLFFLFFNYLYIHRLDKFFSYIIFYSPILFKFWIFFLIFILCILLISSDLCKIFTTPLRLI
jgi:NADH-ubiquinone oxidoreductase chain 6